MQSLSATEAARRFAELLDSVERHGESFLVVRRGRTVARIEPAPVATGKSAKELIRSAPADPAWENELHELRASLAIEDRSWNG